MSQFIQRTQNLFKPGQKEPYKLSRTRLELFYNCPRCFYLDRKLGIDRPPMPSFSLNSAVDELLKKEFDIHRAENHAHPLMTAYKIKAVPFNNPKMKAWRDVFSGIRVWHKETNLLLFGAIDDIWQGSNQELFIVDYKATSTSNAINLDDEYKKQYKRQMEIYQWLARNCEDFKGYKISDTGYFVYCNGRKDKQAFDAKLEFSVEIIPYQGNDFWVEPEIIRAHECLMSDKIPEPSPNCDYCQYLKAINRETT